MSPRIVVTGVSGFIGRHVALEALRRGYHVTGLDRQPSAVDGIEFVQADIRSAGVVRQITKGADYVIHLAAVTSNVEFLKCPFECYDVNVNGFLHVIDAAAANGCRAIVYASSAAVYVDRFAEDNTLDVGAYNNHYAKTKIMNEMVAESYRAVHGLRTIGLRYFNVYGNGENQKGDYASIITLFLRAKARGESLAVYGDGTQARDLVHVDDAAHITVEALERGKEAIYNVGTGQATTYATIAEWIDRARTAYVANPLPSYQHYTCADTTRLGELLGGRRLMPLREGIASMGTAATSVARMPSGSM